MYDMKHRRAARITADDGDGHKLKLSFEFVSTNGLVTDEVREIRTTLARVIARELPFLKWTDFGADNTKVTLLKRL